MEDQKNTQPCTGETAGSAKETAAPSSSPIPSAETALPESAPAACDSCSPIAGQDQSNALSGKKRKRLLFLLALPMVLTIGLVVLLVMLLTTRIRAEREPLCLFREGLLPAAIYQKDSDNKIWGYLDKNGNWAIQPSFLTAGNFSDNGLAPVKSAENRQFGFINKNGDFVIEPNYDDAGEFGEKGLACVKLYNRWGYIDKKGKLKINPQFEKASAFTENGLAAVCIGGKYGYINTKGEYVIEPKYDMALDFSNGSAFVYLYNSWGKIDEKGEWIINPQFDLTLSYGGNQPILVRSDRYFGLCDRDGDFIIQPEYDGLLIYGKYGYLPFFQKGKWGYLNQKGEVVIPAGFSEAYPFSDNGLALARDSESNQYGYINQSGQWVIEPQYESAAYFSKGLAKVYIPAKEAFGYINKNGEIQFELDPSHKEASSFYEDGYAISRKIGKDNHFYYTVINSNGKVLREDLAAIGSTRDTSSLVQLEEIISALQKLITVSH